MNPIDVLLQPSECVLLLVDLQAGLGFGMESTSRQTLLNNAVALARTAVAFKVPTIATTSASKVYSGPLFPQVSAVIPDVVTIERRNMNAWEDEKVRSAVIATGRNQASIEPLTELGADATLPLDQEPEKLTQSFRSTITDYGVNVVLDYLWGASAQSVIEAVSGHGSAAGEPRIRFVQIGAISEGTVVLPAAALRSSGLELMGSGLGSVSFSGLLRSIGELMNAIVPGKFRIEAVPVPLSEVESAWGRDAGGRIVFTVEG